MPLLELSKLRDQAESILRRSEALTSFPCGTFGCPWLEAQAEQHDTAPDGLLLMQDWGHVNDEDEFTPTVKAVRQLLLNDAEHSTSYDRTQKRLFSRRGGWAAPIRAGVWWVSNAVWALRDTGSKTGCLADRIHKRAFPIWLEVVSQLTGQKEDFQLVVAGSWARFDGKVQTTNLRDYLVKWSQWSSVERSPSDHRELLSKAEACAGRVWYLKHPSIWSNQCLEAGPPSAAH